MKMFNLLAVILFSFQIVNAQIEKESISINKCGFNYFSIKDTSKESTIDSIRFIVSSPISSKKAMLLFIQGSGQSPLFFVDGKDFFCSVSSLFPKDFMEKYHIVIISKPGLPISYDFNHRNQIADNQQVRSKFIRNDNLDYYVKASAQVITYLLKKDFIDTNKVYIVGHSQGYSVAAKLACNFSKLITKVVCMSSNPFDRQSISIYSLKKKEMLNELPSNNVQQKLDSIYQHQKLVSQWYLKKDSFPQDDNYFNFLNDYSFNFYPPINYLLKVDKPILIVYGTNDDASALNDYLPLCFYRNQKDNLTILRLHNLDHNYFSNTYDASGKIIKNEFNWPSILTSVSTWLDK
ncbi:MAG: hypothetical protein Q8907_00135 [Bacteroidota bacterium]|nr:hypothetical protein [Bacteroidota bacterium]